VKRLVHRAGLRADALSTGEIACDEKLEPAVKKPQYRSRREAFQPEPFSVATPRASDLCFAHVAYQLQARFRHRQMAIDSFEVRTLDDLERRIGDADVVVVSGLWRNTLLDRTQRLRFIQAIGAGVDQFDRDKLKDRGVRLASARGVNARAVAEHAMALLLALTRKLPEARDNQARHHWRPMISEIGEREDELGGKTLLIVGLGGIGSRLAELAKAFGLRVIGVKRNPATAEGLRTRCTASASSVRFFPRPISWRSPVRSTRKRRKSSTPTHCRR
jgi:phosphoglycerate dehydrogenase-like enzyme